MIPGSQENTIDPNQQEAIRRRSECFSLINEVIDRGNGIHIHDAQRLAQRVSNLYRILPVHNTPAKELGELFEEDRYDYIRKLEDYSSNTSLEPDDYAFKVWSESEKFIERCTTFMNDTLFVKTQKKRKEATEAASYDQI